MLFNKKKTQIADDSAPNPRQPRYDCLAFVRINGFEGQAILRNISAGGFCLESKTYAHVQPGEPYTIEITPVAESGITVFSVKVEARWVKSEVERFNVGFLIVNSAAERHLAKYIDYLKTQSA
jgi:c-di-GMP-binding flagellar brake protein YcgR